MAYVRDVLDLVSKSVMEEVEESLKSNRAADRAQARLRKRALEEWRKSNYPLSYQQDILANLITAINPRRTDVTSAFELTRPSQGGKPLSFFVDSIIKFASHVRRRPPFIQTGSFNRLFKIAVSECRKMYLTHQYPEHDLDVIIVNIATRIASDMKINHIPWIPDRAAGAAGRPSTTIRHDIWLPLGEAEHPRVQPKNNAPASQSQQILRASQRMVMEDPRSEWSACNIRLTNFHKILHKHSLPIEWKFDNSGDEFQSEVYRWVAEHYNPLSKPLHALAIFISLIFAGLLPKIYPCEMQHPANVNDIYQYVRSSPFVAKSSKKGASHTDPFITMVSGFIIAMMDPQSPLLQRNGTSDDQSRRKISNFLNKHSEILLS